MNPVNLNIYFKVLGIYSTASGDVVWFIACCRFSLSQSIALWWCFLLSLRVCLCRGFCTLRDIVLCLFIVQYYKPDVTGMCTLMLQNLPAQW